GGRRGGLSGRWAGARMLGGPGGGFTRITARVSSSAPGPTTNRSPFAPIATSGGKTKLSPAETMLWAPVVGFTRITPSAVPPKVVFATSRSPFDATVRPKGNSKKPWVVTAACAPVVGLMRTIGGEDPQPQPKLATN